MRRALESLSKAAAQATNPSDKQLFVAVAMSIAGLRVRQLLISTS
jgi:hypothetical protein